MKGFEQFQKAMTEAAVQHYKPIMERHSGELEESIKNHLLDLEGPRHVDRPVSVRDQYFRKVFRGFLEISQSLETLDDIAFYINRFPFHQTRITRERYLQFQVESYLSEIYLLHERLRLYITQLERQHKRDPDLTDVQERCKKLTDAITKSLEGVVTVRGRHVHQVRFSDDGIDRLSSIYHLSQIFDDELSNLMKEYYRYEYRKVKKIWRDRIKANNKAIRELLDHFFLSLFPMVFDESTSTLRYPRGARNQSKGSTSN